MAHFKIKVGTEVLMRELDFWLFAFSQEQYITA
jgi:hypothetical protein